MGPVKIAELTESKQTYVETIHSLIRERGYARVADIATILNVKPPSVTSMLQKLDEQKLVNYTRYKGVILTSKGDKLAKTLKRRHQALKEFLVLIGVGEEDADKDACEIEHKINPDTVERLWKFVEFVQSAPHSPPFIQHFKDFVTTGKRPEQCEPSKGEKLGNKTNQS